MKRFSILLTVLFAVSAFACGGKKEGDKPTDKAQATEMSPGDAKPADAKPAVAKDVFNKPELEEKDLSEKGGEPFKGWYAQGPKEASVMQDMSGVRIASKFGNRPDSFDLAWTMEKPDLKEMKANLTKGAEMAKGKLTFTVDTAEALEWTSEFGTSKSHHFSITFQVSGQDVNCYTLPSGEKNPEKFAFLKETCKTIVKK